MAEIVGSVKELWRYPVKSMVGSTLQRSYVEKLGMRGDRGWAIRDDRAGELTSVRKMPRLLLCEALYEEEPEGSDIPQVRIRLPDGSEFKSSDAGANEILSDFLERPVSLWPLQPRSNWQHYRLKKMSGAQAMKKQFSSRELPDMSSVSWGKMLELSIFSTPLGRYHDCYPLHILTSNTLKKLAQIESEGDYCPRRFRPSILIESAVEQARFDEFAWLDGRLCIGETVIDCRSRTVRCLMPAQPQSGLGKDGKVLRVLEKATARHLGINASVRREGLIRVGDVVEWIPARDSILRKAVRSVSGRLKTRLIHTSLKAVDRISAGK